MRREQYADNRKKITAQERAAYKARLEAGKESAIIKFDNDRYVIAEPKISQFLLKRVAKHSSEFFDVGYSEQDGIRLNTDIYQQFDESKKG